MEECKEKDQERRRRQTSQGQKLSNAPKNRILYKPLFSRTVIFAFLDFCGNSRVVNFAIFLMLSLLYIDMNWSGNFREGLAREIRENKTLAKITAYTVHRKKITLISHLNYSIYLNSTKHLQVYEKHRKH